MPHHTHYGFHYRLCGVVRFPIDFLFLLFLFTTYQFPPPPPCYLPTTVYTILFWLFVLFVAGIGLFFLLHALILNICYSYTPALPHTFVLFTLTLYPCTPILLFPYRSPHTHILLPFPFSPLPLYYTTHFIGSFSSPSPFVVFPIPICILLYSFYLLYLTITLLLHLHLLFLYTVPYIHFTLPCTYIYLLLLLPLYYLPICWVLWLRYLLFLFLPSPGSLVHPLFYLPATCLCLLPCMVPPPSPSTICIPFPTMSFLPAHYYLPHAYTTLLPLPSYIPYIPSDQWDSEDDRDGDLKEEEEKTGDRREQEQGSVCVVCVCAWWLDCIYLLFCLLLLPDTYRTTTYYIILTVPCVTFTTLFPCSVSHPS